MFNRRTTMSIKEFCQLQRGELTLNEIRGRRYDEKVLICRDYGYDAGTIESALSFMLGVTGIGLICKINPIETVATSATIGAAAGIGVGSRLTMIASYLLSHKLFVVLSLIIIISTFINMKKQETSRGKIDAVIDGLVSALMLYLFPYVAKGVSGVAGSLMNLFR